MFITALFMITEKQKQPKCVSAYEWINKTCFAHTMEYYSAVKKSEVLIHAMDEFTLWMNPQYG